jgi:hypothetical protein
MLMKIGGLRNGAAWPPIGGIIDLPASEAHALFAHGYAQPLPVEDEVERATTTEDMPELAIVKKVVKRKRLNNG